MAENIVGPNKFSDSNVGVALDGYKPKNLKCADLSVVQLDPLDRHLIITGSTIGDAKLGIGQDPDFEIKLTEAMAQDLQSALAKNAKDVYFMEWEGNKTPAGAKIGGHAIGRTQNGEIVSDKGESLGTYTRILENGGDSKKKQRMIVFLTAKPVEQPEIK
jgi:hypothetical protein